MSEKKSRVSRYQRLHVGVDEFKKQQVLNQERIDHLHELAHSTNVKNEEPAKAIDNTKIFMVDDVVEDIVETVVEDSFDEVVDDVFEDVVVEEVREIDPSSVTAVLNDLKETLHADDVVEEVIEDTIIEEVVEPEVVEKGEVAVIVEEKPTETNEKEEVKRFKKKEKKSKKQRWHNFGIGFFTFCNVCALICFFVAYGPFHQVRDLFVTTAMRTMTKKYLANVLYSTGTIKEILATNVTIEPNEVMDASAISIGNLQEPEVYSSIYEEQVLKRDEGNDLYKVVRLDEDGYKGYITFVYDPTTIDLAVTRYLGSVGEYVTTMAKVNKAAVAINGGGFIDYGGVGSGGQPTGYVIKNGKIVWSRQRGKSWGGGTIGFTKEGVLVLTKKQGKKALAEGIYNGVDFGPFLIVNGKSAEVSGNGGWGVHPRTVIGQRKDGIVVFLTVDGRSTKSLGIDLNTAIEILERYEVYNAANLDGGASTVLAIDGKLVNKPVAYSSTGEREVPTAWIVVPHKE